MKYIELKGRILAAERAFVLNQLDHLSLELLQEIASANLKGSKIRSADLIQMHQDVTAPTILTRVQKLVDCNWIERLDDSADGRSYLLRVTPRAMSIFKMISRELDID